MCPKLTGGQSQCGACGLLFTSTHSFDEHRTGAHGINRRCLTETELRAAGLEPTGRGFWRKPCVDLGARLAGTGLSQRVAHGLSLPPCNPSALRD